MRLKPSLSPRELAEAIGISESSLKRRIDNGLLRAERTGGGHRRIAIHDAIRFIRASRAPLARPEILGLPDLLALPRESFGNRSDSERLYAYLRSGNAAEARGLILALYLSGESVEAIVDGPVHDAMTRIGELWQNDPGGVFCEHRASEICSQAIRQLALLFPPSADGPPAVGGAAPHDPYVLPSLCAAAVLASLGFQAQNLGPDVPLDALAAGVRQHRARLVWLSVSVVADADKLRQDILALADGLGQAVLVVGGQRVEQVALPSHPRIRRGASMTELADIARGLAATADARMAMHGPATGIRGPAGQVQARRDAL